MKKSIGIVGGDLRQRYLINTIKVPAYFYGNDSINESDKTIKCDNIEDLLLKSDIVFLPIPFSKDGTNIFTRYFVETLSVDYLISKLNPRHIVIGGPFTEETFKKIKDRDSKIIEFTKLETFKSQNSIPTAEGVIAVLINQLDFTIYKSKALVIGYGYCGARISKILNGLGAKVDVYTQNETEINKIGKDGFALITDSKIKNKYDYIVNTIPIEIIEYNDIKDSLFVDITKAYSFEGTKFIKMRGIPGKSSPKSSGEMMGLLLNEILKGLIGEYI